jgi:hypothetical protein
VVFVVVLYLSRQKAVCLVIILVRTWLLAGADMFRVATSLLFCRISRRVTDD